MSDELLRFLQTRDPVKVKREWAPASLVKVIFEGQAVIRERKRENTEVEVRIYSKPQCQQSVMTKKAFDRAGVTYIEEDLTEKENVAKLLPLGIAAAPVVVAGNQHWGGYRPDLIQEVVNKIEGK